MEKSIVIVIAIALVLLHGCDRPTGAIRFDGRGACIYDVIVIDGCEYIRTVVGGDKLVHKGNCNNPIHKEVK